MSQPLSLRLPEQTVRRLRSRARRVHTPSRTLAQRYVEEGLRMDEHPLVRFADGPAGRRARIVGTGMDVWEVINVVRDNDGDVHEAADYLEIPLGLVQAAVTYYGATAKKSMSGSTSTHGKHVRLMKPGSLAKLRSNGEAASRRDVFAGHRAPTARART